MSEQTKLDQSSQPPEAALSEMLRGYQLTQLLYVATRLGIPDLLADGPKDPDQLAVACGDHPKALHRHLRALAGLGVFEQVEPGSLALTPLSTVLRSDLPGSLYSSAILAGEFNYGAWGELLYSIRTGSTAFERVHGMPFFEYLAQHPEVAMLFDEQMASGEERYAAIARSYDYSRFRTVVDIGGGVGAC